jgi:hypothetical protein
VGALAVLVGQAWPGKPALLPRPALPAVLRQVWLAWPAWLAQPGSLRWQGRVPTGLVVLRMRAVPDGQGPPVLLAGLPETRGRRIERVPLALPAAGPMALPVAPGWVARQ